MRPREVGEKEYLMCILVPVFSTPHPESGGMARISAVTKSFIENGHDVLFLASGFQARLLQQDGYRVVLLPEPRFFGLPDRISRLVEKKIHSSVLPISMTSVWFLYSFAGNAQLSFLKAAIKTGLETVESFRPDALFTDYSPVAFLLHAATGIPAACTYSDVFRRGTGSIFYKLNRWSTNKIIALSDRAGTETDDLYFGSDILKIVPTIPELDDADGARPDIYYAGSLLTEPPRAEIAVTISDGRRYVLVYVGTGSLPMQKLRSVLPEIFPKDGKVQCVVGCPGMKESYSIAGVEFHPYVDIGKLLPKCDWTICHGGQNTIVESLLHNVPAIAIPGNIWERRYNARKLHESGAGVMLEIDEFCPGRLKEIMKQQESCRMHAVRLSNALHLCDGLHGAYRRLIDHFTRKSDQQDYVSDTESDSGNQAFRG